MAEKFANSQDLVQVKKIENDTLILKDGSMHQILMVQGTNFSLKSEEEQNMLTASYQNFLNSLDFGIQISIHSRKLNIQKYLDDLDQRAQAEPSPLLQNQIGEYKEFVRKFVQDNAIMEKTFLVMVPWYPAVISASGGLSLPFMKKKPADQKQAEERSEQDFQQNLLQLKQRVGQVMEGLTAVGLESLVLTDQELTQLLYNFYNPETVEKEGNIPQNAG